MHLIRRRRHDGHGIGHLQSLFQIPHLFPRRPLLLLLLLLHMGQMRLVIRTRVIRRTGHIRGHNSRCRTRQVRGTRTRTRTRTIISILVLPRRRRFLSAPGRAAANIRQTPPVLADDLLPLRQLLPLRPGGAVLPDDDGEDPERPHGDGDARVRGSGAAAGLLAGEREAEAPVDDAEGDAHAADPDVHVGDPAALPERLEAPVVQGAPEGLGEQHDEEHDAEDGVRVRGQAATRRGGHHGGHHGHEVQPQTRGRDVQRVRHELDDAVREERVPAAREADHDGAEGEEEREGERGQEPVAEAVHHEPLVVEAAVEAVRSGAESRRE